MHIFPVHGWNSYGASVIFLACFYFLVFRPQVCCNALFKVWSLVPYSLAPLWLLCVDHVLVAQPNTLGERCLPRCMPTEGFVGDSASSKVHFGVAVKGKFRPNGSYARLHIQEIARRKLFALPSKTKGAASPESMAKAATQAGETASTGYVVDPAFIANVMVKVLLMTWATGTLTICDRHGQ